MKYDFDTVINRRNTNCVKWDETDREDVIPLWVADMDFHSFPGITDALYQRVGHGIFGYTHVPDSYYNAVIRWFDERHGLRGVLPSDIIYTSGVVPAISAIFRALTLPGDKVLVMTPVYNCFFTCIRNQGCTVEESHLVYKDNTFEVDWEDFENKCADERVRLFLLCNPHNPAGRVWTKDELGRIGEICQRNHVLVISDEIHCDLVLPGYKHTPFATLGHQYALNSITFHAASKTFNLAGLATSTAIIPNEALRKTYVAYVEDMEAHLGNIFGKVSTQAAMTYGDEWLGELLDYVQGNIDYVADFLTTNLPKVKFHKPQATYMMWLDFNGYGLSEEELWRKMTQEAQLGFNRGKDFGEAGNGFFRINLACPRSTVEEAMRRLKEVF